MEEAIQIIIFIAMISIMVIKKSRDFNKNRPGQSVQPSADSSTSMDDDFSDENEDIEQEFSDEMVSEEQFSEEEFPTEDEDFDWEECVSEQDDLTKNGTDIEYSEKQEKGFAPSTLQSDLKKPEEPCRSSVLPPLQTVNASHSKDEIHQPLKQPEKESEKEPMIRLKSRKEARRAFIYAEIFNRRYE